MSNINIFINDISCSGGTERVACFLANRLVTANFNVTIVSLFGEERESYYALSSKVKIRYVGGASLLVLLKFIRNHPCDVLISLSMGRLSFKLSMLNAIMRFSFKLILSEHVAYEASPALVRILKLMSYQFADTLVLLTEHDYNIIQKKVRAKTHIIRNASAFECCNISELEYKEKIVLAVGRLTYQKAFDRLIEIWASMDNHNGWKLRIVGEGEERSTLQKLISELGLDDSISLISASKSIETEYRKASVLVMTSRYEGLPLVLIESKSFGLPAVAFDCKTGPKELISHKSDGFLIEDGESDAFKKSLEMLINDDVLRIAMQRQALKSSLDYSESLIFDKWLKLL